MIIKRGDSFLLAFAVTVDGAAQDLTHWQVKAAAAGGFSVFPIDVAFTDRVAGEFLLSAETATWPPGNMTFDVRYTTDAGQIVTTASVPFMVIQGATG